MNVYPQGKLIVRLVLSASLCLAAGCVAQQSGLTSIAPTGIDNPHDVLPEEDKLSNQSYASLVEKGNQYLENGDYNLAKVHFTKAQAMEEKPTLALIGLGNTFLQAGQLDASKRAFSKVMDLDGLNRSALLGLGKLCRIQGNFGEAQVYLQNLLNNNPVDTEALTEMAINYDTSDKGPYAELYFLKVTEIQPDNASAFNNLGFNLLLQGKYPSAISALLQASYLNPVDRRIQNNLAAAYILAGEEGKGLNLFESSVGQAAAFNNVGYIYLTQEKWLAAETAFTRAMEINPSYYVKAKKNLDYMKSLHAAQRTETGTLPE